MTRADIGPAVVILAPIVTPVMTQLGFDPLHFAIIMMVNVNIGNATPPMGMSLMVASQIADVPYEVARCCLGALLWHLRSPGVTVSYNIMAERIKKSRKLNVKINRIKQAIINN